jgi:hypothetical protein
MAIRFERDGAVGNIVLADPPFNRLDLRFAEALRIAVHQASESDIRVLVVAGRLGIATHVAPENQLLRVAAALTHQLATGPTRSYAATRTLLKAWSSGGVAAADIVTLDVAMELFNGADAQRGFVNTAKAFDNNIEPQALVFEGK